MGVYLYILGLLIVPTLLTNQKASSYVYYKYHKKIKRLDTIRWSHVPN